MISVAYTELWDFLFLQGSDYHIAAVCGESGTIGKRCSSGRLGIESKNWQESQNFDIYNVQNSMVFRVCTKIKHKARCVPFDTVEQHVVIDPVNVIISGNDKSK